MRELIRPTLFMIARLGLLVAIAGWLASQWWNFELNLDTDNGRRAGVAGVVDQGWGCIGKFAVYPTSTSLSVTSPEPLRFGAMYLRAAFGDDAKYLSSWVDWQFNLVGFRVAFGPLKYFSVRHELVFTLSALFNGVLMWVYRKRGKDLAADE